MSIDQVYEQLAQTILHDAQGLGASLLSFEATNPLLSEALDHISSDINDPTQLMQDFQTYASVLDGTMGLNPPAGGHPVLQDVMHLLNMLSNDPSLMSAIDGNGDLEGALSQFLTDEINGSTSAAGGDFKHFMDLASSDLGAGQFKELLDDLTSPSNAQAVTDILGQGTGINLATLQKDDQALTQIVQALNHISNSSDPMYNCLLVLAYGIQHDYASGDDATKAATLASDYASAIASSQAIDQQTVSTFTGFVQSVTSQTHQNMQTMLQQALAQGASLTQSAD